MNYKTVVISCAPALNEAQSDGLEQVIKDFENAGCRVYYYGNTVNLMFERYTLKKLAFNKVLYKAPFYWVLQHIKTEKWIARLARHFPPSSNQVADYKTLRSIIRMAVQYFCSVKPDLFLCWNPHSPSFGPMNDTARLMGISTGAIEWGLLPGTFILDADGTLFTSRIFNREVSYSDPAQFLETGERVFNELNQKSVSFYHQAVEALPEALSNINGPHIKVLVVGIDMVDSGSLPETDAERSGLLPFHSSCHAQALAIANSDSNFRVVLKPHPSHNYNLQNSEISTNCWVINSNPDELIKWADVVVCSGSKMEFSSLLAGKPLVNVGAGILYKKGCSYEVDTPLHLRERILKAVSEGFTGKQLSAFKLFLGFLHDDYLYVYDRPHNNTKVINRMLQQTSIFDGFIKRLFK